MVAILIHQTLCIKDFGVHHEGLSLLLHLSALLVKQAPLQAIAVEAAAAVGTGTSISE